MGGRGTESGRAWGGKKKGQSRETRKGWVSRKERGKGVETGRGRDRGEPDVGRVSITSSRSSVDCSSIDCVVVGSCCPATVLQSWKGERGTE